MGKKMRGNQDMTKGSIMKNLIQFSLPLIASSFLQMVYNAADIVVVGRFAGTQAQAAVGSSSSLVSLFTMLFIGISIGSNVVIAQFHGAREHDKVSRAIHTSIALALVSGVIVMAVGLLTSRVMLQWMGSPDDVNDLANLYVMIIFLGAPVSMLYNFGASVLRALGDSRRPLIYLAVSGAVNVVLNLLLVIVFHMSVAGVGIATVVSQALSAALVLIHLMRSQGSMHLDIRKLKLEKEFVKPIIRIGLPSGIQSSMFAISNTIIQSAVNAQGAIVMAGNSAAANLESFVHLAMSAFATSMLTFSSTNRGAKRYDRVRKGLWVAMGIVTVLGISTGIVALLFGRPLLSLYNSDPQVIDWGMVRMGIMLIPYFLCGLMEIASAQLRGLRYAIAPMVSSITGVCGMRIVWIYTVFAANPTMQTLYISYPISWTIVFIAHMTCYFLFALPGIKREEKEWLAAQGEAAEG